MLLRLRRHLSLRGVQKRAAAKCPGRKQEPDEPRYAIQHLTFHFDVHNKGEDAAMKVLWWQGSELSVDSKIL